MSSHEAFGISVAESLTAGVPCLVANCSGLVEWIDNVNCFGIDLPVKMSDLANSIQQNINKKIKKFSFASWDDVTNRIDAIYNSNSE